MSLNIKYNNIQIFSMGGSGSYFMSSVLRKCVGKDKVMYDVHGHKLGWGYKHQGTPPKKLEKENSILIYLYCLPYNHAYYLYNRGQYVEHYLQIHINGKYKEKLQSLKIIEQFIDNKIDYYGYYEHLHNFIIVPTSYSRILVKYEALEFKMAALFDLLSISHCELPEFKSRKTDYNNLPSEYKQKLTKMFKKEYDLYINRPDIEIIKGEQLWNQ